MSSCRETDSKQCYFHILTSQTESKISSLKHAASFLRSRTADWHRKGLGSLCMEVIGLSPVLLMKFYLILLFPSTVVKQPSCHFWIEVKSNDDGHLESFDALVSGRRILKN